MPLSKQEIEALAEEIVKRKPGPTFYVDPEEHYKQHERLERFLDTYDSASNLIFKFFLGVFLVGVVAAVSLGIGYYEK